MAALMGKKNEKHVKRGWITYKEGVMLICTGPTAAPPGTQHSFFVTCSYAIQHQYKPKTEEGALRRMEVKIRSLQEFFGFAEGLLRTLG